MQKVQLNNLLGHFIFFYAGAGNSVEYLPDI
jgi:hypothetical protein